jgi:hypothetical protein
LGKLQIRMHGSGMILPCTKYYSTPKNNGITLTFHTSEDRTTARVTVDVLPAPKASAISIVGLPAALAATIASRACSVYSQLGRRFTDNSVHNVRRSIGNWLRNQSFTRRGQMSGECTSWTPKMETFSYARYSSISKSKTKSDVSIIEVRFIVPSPYFNFGKQFSKCAEVECDSRFFFPRSF